MSKLLIFSDIHIHPHKGSQTRLEDCLEVLEWVFSVARRRKIKHVIFGGDLFENRQKIQVFAYNRAFNVIAENDDIKLHLLLGNHDLWYYESTKISSVRPFSALPNVTVYGEPGSQYIGEDIQVDFLPFTHNPIKTLKDWKNRSAVLFGHIAVDGSVLNFHHRTKAEVSVVDDTDMTPVSRDLFDGWDRVFLGHYHGAQKLTDKVEYIGSPLQLTFGEAYQQKHIIQLDTETMETEYIKNDFSPKHLMIDAEEMPEELGRNFIKVYVENLLSADIVDLKSKVRDSQAQVMFLPKEQDTDKTKQDEKLKKFNVAEGDWLERFIAASNTESLDPKILLSVAKEEICIEN